MPDKKVTPQAYVALVESGLDGSEPIIGAVKLAPGTTVDVASEPSGNGDYTTPTHSTLSVTTTSQIALVANPNRLYASFQNDSDTVIYIMEGVTAVANQGRRLNANGGSYEMSKKLGNLYVGTIYAIHGGTGSKVLLITEGI